MKKLTALLFCVAMLFSLAACGSKISDDALDKFESVIQNMEKMKSADYSVSMRGFSEDKTQELKLDGSYDVQNAKPLISAVLTTEIDKKKQDASFELYIDGENVYLNIMGLLKRKQPLTAALPTGELPSLGSATDTFNLPKEELKEYLQEASIDDDTLTLVFDCEKLMKDAEKGSDLQGGLIGESTFNELSLVINLKDNLMKKAVLSMDMTKTVDGKKKNTVADIDVEFKNINKISPIKFPDFTDYIESESGTNLIESFL